MNKNPPPRYATREKGRNWSTSLVSAHKTGAVIVVEETGEPVSYDRGTSGPRRFRPWVAQDGTRYDSFECVPEF